jgi:hypothetical protein
MHLSSAPAFPDEPLCPVIQLPLHQVSYLLSLASHLFILVLSSFPSLCILLSLGAQLISSTKDSFNPDHFGGPSTIISIN